MTQLRDSTQMPVRICSPGLRKFLLRLNLVGEEQLVEAESGASNNKILSVLSARGDIDEDVVLRKLADDLSLKIIEPRDKAMLRKLRQGGGIHQLEAEFALKHRCVAVGEENGKTIIAMADPLDTETLSAVEFILGASVQVALAKESDIALMLDEVAGSRMFEEAVAEMGPDPELESAADIMLAGEDGSDNSMKAGSESAPVVRMVNKILTDAFERNVSDIHLEPTAGSLEVRLRVDGVLSSYLSIPKRLQGYVSTRIKILAGMDITEKRRPQDGRFRVSLQESAVGDIRASTVPTPFGEKLVLRVLGTNFGNMGLEALGMPADVCSEFTQVLTSRDRMVVVTGPTGSGKSTTLYSAIHHLKQGTNNIITVEDPIEYRIEGITQIQVDQKIGMTFASGLRSILRQDPDIIMVGEIRDGETAEVGFQAAQTGHLVLATLHTNSAVSAVIRLVDLGIEPFLIASSLGSVLAQRLVRRACPSCKKPMDPGKSKLLAEQHNISSDMLIEAVGCRACDYSGYRGRIGVYSLLKVDRDISNLIRERKSEQKIEGEARKRGMETLFEAGCRIAAEGITTIEEIERVIGGGMEDSPGESVKTAEGANLEFREEQPGDGLNKVAEVVMEEAVCDIESVDDLCDFIISGAEDAANLHQDALKHAADIATGEMEKAGSVADLATAYKVLEDEGVRAKKILLVDDDEGVRVVLSRALRKLNFEVCEACDGLDAIEKLDNFYPDIVVSDLIMPRLDGKAFVERLREQKKTKQIPILIISGSDSESNEIKLIKAGANDFVSKSSSPAVVIARIKRLLGN